jgi:hypothetical protein
MICEKEMIELQASEIADKIDRCIKSTQIFMLKLSMSYFRNK